MTVRNRRLAAMKTRCTLLEKCRNRFLLVHGVLDDGCIAAASSSAPGKSMRADSQKRRLVGRRECGGCREIRAAS
jgi:hypothetical protein